MGGVIFPGIFGLNGGGEHDLTGQGVEVIISWLNVQVYPCTAFQITYLHIHLLLTEPTFSPSPHDTRPAALDSIEISGTSWPTGKKLRSSPAMFMRRAEVKWLELYPISNNLQV